MPEFIFSDKLFEPFCWKLNRNYPFIQKLKERLYPVWEERKDFSSFIKEINKNLLKE